MQVRVTFSMLVRPGLTEVCVGIAVFAACWALAWLSVSTSPDRGAAAIRTAFASRDLRPDAVWRLGDTDIGAHQFNDCLLLGQALDRRAPARMLAVSPLSTVTAPGGPCLGLQRLAEGSPPRQGSSTITTSTPGPRWRASFCRRSGSAASESSTV